LLRVLLGEDPRGIPNNLLPFLSQVAVGKRDYVNVYGQDYDTPDGTGLRDYIHVIDLAKGHVAALVHNVLNPQVNKSCDEFNLGTGETLSVLEMVKAMEAACGKPIPYSVAERRAGDVARIWGDPSKAARMLHWKTELSVEQAVADAWRWQLTHPNGFESEDGTASKNQKDDDVEVREEKERSQSQDSSTFKVGIHIAEVEHAQIISEDARSLPSPAMSVSSHSEL